MSPTGLRVAFFGQSGPMGASCLMELAPLLGRAGMQLALAVEAARRGQKPPPWWRRGFLQPRGRIKATTETWSLAAHASRRGVRHAWCEHGDDVDTRRALASERIDAIAVCGLPFLLSARLLHSVGVGLNAHPSALPRWRGPAPLFWWLRSGDPDTALSIHMMDARADHGPVLARVPLAPPIWADGPSLFALAGRAAARPLLRALTQWADATAMPNAQLHTRATWAPRPRAEDGFFSPSAWRCAPLARFCCGAPAFVTPSFVAGGERHFVRRACAVQLGWRLPGDFVRVGDELWVQAQDGAVSLQCQ